MAEGCVVMPCGTPNSGVLLYILHSHDCVCCPPCHRAGSTWRHFEELTLPDGLLVMGDSCSSFNPTYGQGMTVAVMEAVALRDMLAARRAAAAAGCSNRHQGSGLAPRKPCGPKSPVTAVPDAAPDSHSSSGGSASSIGSGVDLGKCNLTVTVQVTGDAMHTELGGEWSLSSLGMSTSKSPWHVKPT